MRWGWVLVGIVLILIGVWLIYTPLIAWPYLIGIFLILMGIWSLIRVILRRS